MFFSRNKKFTKAVTLIVSALFVLQVLWPALLAALPANAQYTDPARVVDSAQEKIAKVGEKAKDGIAKQLYKGLLLTVSVTVKNLLIKMARKLAEQSVTYMASGSWGEGSMFYEDAFKEFQRDLKDQMIGQFLDNMSDFLGMDVCNPSLPEFELGIKLGFQFNYLDVGYEQLKKPDCTLQKLKGNWKAFGAGIQEKYNSVLKEMKNPSGQSLAMLQETFDVAFTPSKSDVGIYLSAESKMLETQIAELEAKEKQRQEDQGTKGVTGIAGLNIKTPSSLTRAHSEQELEKAKQTEETEVNASSEVLTSIPEQVAIAFLNTFVSQFFQKMIMDKYFKKGLVDPSKSYNPEQHVMDTKQTTAAEFASVKMDFSFSQKQIDLLTEYSTCSLGAERQLNSCVMDGNFADAVRNASQDKPFTVAQAMESKGLDGAWPIIGPDDDRHKSDNCYASGYCYSNLVKLRKARIIPIGWELAALKVESGSTITLKNVVDNYTIVGSPFYHLIDPNWALRYPQSQCKAVVSGQLLVSAGAAERADYCADIESCIRMNDQGKCEAYGYCAAEKNIFRFGGTECNGAYDSCRVLKNAKGKEVSYLFNTVDRKFCDSGSVGCAWYSAWKTKTNDNWQWEGSADKRIYLNQKIYDMDCKPNDEGCTRMVRTAAGLGTNLIANGGVEQQTASESEINNGTDVSVPGWQGASWVVNGGYDGNYAVTVDSASALTANAVYLPPKFYTRYFAFSAFAKKITDAPTMSMALVSGPAENETVKGVSIILDPKIALNDEWTKVYFIMQMLPPEFGEGILTGGDIKLKLTVQGGSVLVDQVMLEEISSPFPDAMHAYTEYATQNVTYLKKAPTYLACYNNSSSDPDVAKYLEGRPHIKSDILDTDDAKSDAKFKGCDKFARLCTASDVGCDSYKPTDKGSTIYGVSSYSDYCPQQCVGYESYAKSPTFFELGEFPLYFIPKTGAACSSAEAGCEEFTNLDELAKGGEAKEYYIEPKLCAKLPDSAAQCETYYTWESKEVTGYKLQSYVLQKGAEGAPKLVFEAYENDCSQEIYLAKTNPDCRQFFNKAGQAFYGLASKTITCSTDCHPYRRTLLFDSEQLCVVRQGLWKNGECISMIIPGEGKKCGAANAGCREYKGNQSGVEHVLENFTFSLTDNASNPLEDLNYSAGKPVTTVEFGPVMQVEKAGDEASIFTNADKLALSTDEYRLSFWVRRSGTADGYFEAQLRDGDTVKYTLGKAGLPYQWTQFSFQIKPEWLGDVVSVGVAAEQNFQIDNFKIVRVAEYEYLIKNSWVTPTACDYKLNSDTNSIFNNLPQAMLGCREFIDKDNVKNYLKSFSGLCSADKIGCEAVIDTQNNAWPVEKDYKVEVSMDRLCYEFASAWPKVDGATAVNGAYIKQPAGAYTASQVRCSIPIKNLPDNGNTDPYFPYGNVDGQKQSLCSNLKYSWNETEDKCYEIQAHVPDDRLMYLVINKSATCDSGAKGCTALGLPTLTVDKDGQEAVKKTKDAKGVETEVWSNQFYRLDPDMAEAPALNNPLCRRSESGCGEFKDAKGAAVYFKDPGDKVCEYRKVTDPNGGTDAAYGWYRKKLDQKSADEKCVSEDYYNIGINNLIMNSDREDNIATTTDVETYAGWVGACPKKEDKCTAFVDPTDIQKSSYGKPYYFINDDKIDQGTCNNVNRKDGCALFYNTANTDPNKGGALGFADANFLAFDTYIASNAAAKAVAPVQESKINEKQSLPCLPSPYGNCSDRSPLSADTKQILKDLYASLDVNKCQSATYCPFMADCIAKENSTTVCYDRVEDTDVAPAVDNIQRNCTNPNADNPAQNQTIMENLNAAITNAYCTVRKIMKPNANTVVKVIQDRDCAEWFACQSSHWNWDPAAGKYVEACDRVGLCDKLDPGKESVKCQRFVNQESADDLLSKNKVIADGYQTRSTGWYAFDYSGYAIPQIAPIQFYNAFDVNQGNEKMTCGGWSDGVDCTQNGQKTCDAYSSDQGECMLVRDYRLANQSGLTCKVDKDCLDEATEMSNSMKNTFCAKDEDNNKWGDTFTDPADGKVKVQNHCRCLGNVCVRPYAPKFDFEHSEAPACRAYPEKESPFPSYVKNLSQYSSANLLYAKAGSVQARMDLACRYRKVTYGGGAITKYFPTDPLYTPSLISGYCQDNAEAECECDAEEDLLNGKVVINTATMCSTTSCIEVGSSMFGTCYKRDTKIVNYNGWQGYCLERDASINLFNESDSHPCLTWYPSQGLAGLMDTNNQYDAAGFNAAAYGYFNDGPYYCTEANRWERRETFVEQEKGYIDCDGNEYNKHPSGYTPEVDESTGGACMETEIGWEAVDLYDCITKDCWDQDCGGGDVDRPYCPQNYDVGNITFYDHGDEAKDQCSVEDEDKMFFQYWCKPSKASVTEDRDADPATTQKFWFPDYNVKNVLGGDEVLKAYGGTADEKINETPLIKKSLTEVERLNCDKFYLMNKGGENKAFTNRIYQGYDVWSNKCPSDTSIKIPKFNLAVEDTLDVSSNKNCGPYGALGLDVDAASVTGSIENILLYAEDMTKPDEIKCSIESGQVNKNGGAQCFANFEGQLNELFAKHYGSWTMQTKKSTDNGVCYSKVFPELNSVECDDDAKCKSEPVKEYCMHFELKTCTNKGPNNTTTPCFTDMDCEYDVAFAEKDKDGEPIMKACTGPASPVTKTKKKCNSKSADAYLFKECETDDNCQLVPYCKLGGPCNVLCTDETSLLDNCSGFDDDDYVHNEKCYLNRYLSDKTNCEYFWWANSSDGTPQTPTFKQGTDSLATCNLPYYPSSDVAVKYIGGNNEKDISQTAIISPPTIAGVVSAGKADSGGKPMYSALPNKMTISTPTATKNSGDIVGEGGQLEVMVKFYAWADDDQMPLTKVKVYWGNGGAPSGSDGAKYQNHKPRCQRKAHELLGLCFDAAKFTKIGDLAPAILGYACSLKEECEHLGDKFTCGKQVLDQAGLGQDRFGDTANKTDLKANACMEGYFSFSNTYTCSAADLALNESCTTDSQQSCIYTFPAPDGRKACRYRPAVQVMDNWEWCNANHDKDGKVVDVKDGTVVGETGYWGEACIVDKTYNINNKEYYDGFIYVIP